MPNYSKSMAVRRFQCRHIFTDGHRCGSPCLRGLNGPEDFCYYHHTTRRPKPQAFHDPFLHPPNETSFTLPIPEDPSAIQHAIGEIMNQLARNALDPRRAGLLLYALQIASLNLQSTSRRNDSHAELNAAPETVEDFTLDPELGPLAPPSELGATNRKAPPSASSKHSTAPSTHTPPNSPRFKPSPRKTPNTGSPSSRQRRFPPRYSRSRVPHISPLRCGFLEVPT